jgi:hypothetical protein
MVCPEPNRGFGRGLKVEYIQRRNFRKDDRIEATLAQLRVPLRKSTRCLGALPLPARAH